MTDPVTSSAGGDPGNATIPAELIALGFRPAGAIRTLDGKTCRFCCDGDEVGYLVYAQIVDNRVMKFGTSKTSLAKRMTNNAQSINQVIAFVDGGAPPRTGWQKRPLDAFKRLAPEAIRAKKDIAVWVRPSAAHEYLQLERELNARYETIRNGWALRLG